MSTAAVRCSAWTSAYRRPRPSRPPSFRELARRGLRGVKLVISDAHEGIKAAVAKVLNAAWRRCRVRFMRNALASIRVSRAAIASIQRKKAPRVCGRVFRGAAAQFSPETMLVRDLMTRRHTSASIMAFCFADNSSSSLARALLQNSSRHWSSASFVIAVPSPRSCSKTLGGWLEATLWLSLHGFQPPLRSRPSNHQQVNRTTTSPRRGISPH